MKTEELHRWYARARRELPWRSDSPDPYAVLVSEVMLQQTTVAAVVPYFRRFLARFPTVGDLAAAELDRVLELWAGLGYYRRARNLHAAARAIVAAGGFPREVEALRELPGVGPYTAGALASIAFDRPEALVDGNVARVLSRVFAVPGDPRTKAKRKLWEIARSLVPARGARVHNQALMELGALVCTPTGPRCEECPVAGSCLARSRGEVERFPELAPRPEVRRRRDLALVFSRKGRWLFGRRPEDEVWGGLWELPRVTLLARESDEDAARRLGRELLGCGATLIEGVLARVQHTVMRERIELRVMAGELRGAPTGRRYAELRWVTPGESEKLALPSPQRRAVIQARSR